MELLPIILTGILLTFILVYSFVQLDLVLSYRRSRKGHSSKVSSPPELPSEGLPYVTVQLPVYNEYYVVERLIQAVSGMRYPRDRFEIQVLDDSTDETVEVIRQKVEALQQMGEPIHHVRRDSREGYKAGALAFGTRSAKGELIAVFDADFLPPADFLERTVPYFNDQHVGLVQTRWEHLNEDHSLLTKLQAFGLNAHFSIEQVGRNSKGHFMNFNGTAGVWRKECIQDSGGWKPDTLTEDLDLSYRAQMKGWKFKFLEDVGAPAELPAAMNSLKTQQYRWNKGAAECTRKNLPNVLGSKDIPLKTKLHAIFHLMNSFVFVCVLITAILSIPTLFIKHNYPEYGMVFKLAGIYTLALVFLIAFYWNSLNIGNGSFFKKFFRFVRIFPLFLSVSMGMSLHNGIAVIEGLIGKRSSFVRTPKFNIVKKGDDWFGKKYLSGRITPLTFLEGVLSFYFLAGIFLGFYFNDLGLLPFHLMLTLGFGYVFFYSFKHAK